MEPRLVEQIEDLEAELQSILYYRRSKLITKAAYDRQKKKLKGQLERLEERLADARAKARAKALALAKKNTKLKTNFVKDLNKKFTTQNAFRIYMGNNFIADKDILKQITRQAGKWLVKVGDKYYTLNDTTKQRLSNLIQEGTAIVGGGAVGANPSDEEFYEEYADFEYIELEKIVPMNVYQMANGAFFQYTHLTNFDLTRYGLFKLIDAKNYKDTCLIYALKQGGLSDEKLDQIKIYVKNRNIPKKDIQKICDLIKIKIIVKTEDHNHKITYGKQHDETYTVGLLDDHYFIVEKTDITSFCLENYDTLKDKERCNHIYNIQNGIMKRDPSRCIDSFDVVKLLLKNKDTLLKRITMDDRAIATTQFYDSISDELVNLEYNIETCSKPVEPKEIIQKETKEKPVYKNVFFDFETYTKDGVHIPYLCRTFDGKESKAFYGEECGLSMLCSLKSDTRLIAHNATYDYRFIIKYLNGIEEMSRGNKLIGGSAVFNKHKIQIKDSLHLISMALSKFPKVFDIPNTIKEIMPYELYKEDTVKQRNVPIKDALKFIEPKDHAQFLENIKRWGCFRDNETYDIIEYSSRYCAIDCEILSKGYNKFRDWILELLTIDIDEVLTAASLAHKYFVNQGCYKDVFQLSGVPQIFIQGCVVGGRVMCAENKKIFLDSDKKKNDFDGVSLYPSSMYRMDGFLKGTPKVIQKENLNYEWLQQQDGYFIDILINRVGKSYKFPLMSYKNEEGVRHFTNDMVGRKMRVDKTTLEDLIEFHQIDFTPLRGYYFDDGFNTTIKETILFLFNERLRMKKEGNPAQEVYKLIMNSGYGKSIMKPVDTETRFFDDEEKFKVYLSRNYNWITSFIKFGTKTKVSSVKTLIDHYNIAQVGVCILSMSKRIMNEVMCLAEDERVDIYYQDTDSMHLNDCDIDKLSSAFTNKYGRELVGKKLGQFHSDFELGGCKDVYASRSIFLGKKCYIDELKGTDEKTGEEKTGFHIRMKGIPNRCIYYACDKLGYATPFELYKDLMNGKPIMFDLTNGGTKVNFKMNSNYTVNTLGFFQRVLSF